MKKGNYFDVDNLDDFEFIYSRHGPHSKALELVEGNSTVLDIGCSKGYVGIELKKKNCRLFGIDRNPNACAAARKHYQEVIEADLEETSLNLFPGKAFDYIICLDILEHLSRPDLLLSKLREILSPRGKVIISLPNIARIENRLQLLLGRFAYTYTGALYREHLRFFTLSSAKDFIKSCRYKIKKIEATGFGSMIKILPSLFAYQFIFVCEAE